MSHRRRPAEAKVTVGFLHPGHYAECFAESLKDLLFHDAAHHQRIVSHTHGQLGKRCGSGQLVDGRNQVTAGFLEGPAEWLFFVDSDMGFAADTVERLIAAADPVARPVMGALCFASKNDGKASLYGIRSRAQPTLYSYYEDDERAGFVPMFDYPRDEVVPVAGTGAAAILIHRSVAEAIAAKYGPSWWDIIAHPKGATFSEDLSFCVRVAAVDRPIHVHTGVKTTHDKGFAFLDEEFYDAQERAAGRRPKEPEA